jgi:cytochrome c oxidase subunit IV
METVAHSPTSGSELAKPHVRPPYMLIWVILAVLTAVEVGITMVSHFSKGFTIFALLVLAIWKAVLVALYYMHLRFEPTRLRLLVLVPLPLAVLLVVAVLTEF